MTTAFSSSTEPDRHWILRYVGLQNASDKRVLKVLLDALGSVDKALKVEEGKEKKISVAVRRAQLLGNKGAISLVLRELYKELGDVIRADQAEAAGLAAKLMYEDEKKVWAIVERDKTKRDQLEKSLETKARRNVQSMIKRVLVTEMPLSKRLYTSEAHAKGSVGKVINNHLARGSSAADLAKDVHNLFNPRTPGGIPHAARRLARTEIHNAFHAQSISDAAERPWISQVKWNLSKSHPQRAEPCLCERYAEQKYFPANDVPKSPHPNCLCSITPVIPDFDTAYDDFSNGKYNDYLDSVVR